MKLLKQFSVIFISAFLFIVLAEQEELVLQNGLNQYNECSDSYVHNKSSTTNYANSKTLEIRCDGC